MRDRFSELIKKGVASFEEKPVSTPIPTHDPMVRAYNNLWGALTDTHMSAIFPDEYIITGTFVKSQYWEGFKYCSYYGSTNIKLGSGYPNLENMVRVNGYRMTPDTYNGDYVIKLTKCPEPSTEDPNGVPVGDQCCGTACCPTCPCIYSLGESQIPHPFKESFTEGQIKDICEAWKDANGNAEKIIENLKGYRDVDENRFAVSADGLYMIVDEKLRIPLNAR